MGANLESAMAYVMVAILRCYTPDMLLAAYIAMMIANILVPNRHQDTRFLSQ